MSPFPILAELGGDVIFLIIVAAIAGLQKLFEFMKKSKEENPSEQAQPTRRERRSYDSTSSLPGNYQKRQTGPKTVLNKAPKPRQATISQPYDRSPTPSPTQATPPSHEPIPQASYSAPNPYSAEAIAHAEQQALASLQTLSDAEKAALASLQNASIKKSDAYANSTKVNHSRQGQCMSGKELKTWIQHPNALKTAVLFKEILGSPKALQ